MSNWTRGREQAGFSKSNTTIDHIFTLNQPIEKTIEYDMKLFLLSVDFSETFDTVKYIGT